MFFTSLGKNYFFNNRLACRNQPFSRRPRISAAADAGKQHIQCSVKQTLK